MAMAQVQVLHDVLQSGIRWRVTLHACPAQGALVRFEKSGKGGRLLHQESAQWNRLAGGFLLPRERVAGGMVPKYLVERIEAILRGSPLPARRAEREQVRGRLVPEIDQGLGAKRLEIGLLIDTARRPRRIER